MSGPATAMARAAARNNAEWCDLVCREHGIATSFEQDVWAAHRRSPPLYPDAVTLTPSAGVDEILRRLEPGSGCSIKDSFSTLNLETYGLEVLFDGEWIYRAPASPTVDGSVWSRARPEDVRSMWGAAVPPALLASPAVAMLVARAGGEKVGGIIANRSDDVVGVSNMVVVGTDPDVIRLGAIAAVSAAFPGLPLVGYESGDDLAAAERAGFDRIGPLRVWLALD